MTWTNLNDPIKRPSDLIVNHPDGNFQNDSANITPPAGGAIIPLGTVVFRAKGLAKSAAWTVVDDAADVVTTNEFAVVYGDHYGWKPDFAPKAIAAGKYNAIVIKRGPVMLKEYYIKAVHKTQLGASYEVLKGLLAAQNLVVLDDISDLTAA